MDDVHTRPHVETALRQLGTEAGLESVVEGDEDIHLCEISLVEQGLGDDA